MRRRSEKTPQISSFYAQAVQSPLLCPTKRSEEFHAEMRL